LAYVADRALGAAPVGTVGLELEGHLIDRADPGRRVSWDEVCRLVELVGELPNDSRISVEPGGQLELSTLPMAGVEAVVTALRTDEQVLLDLLRAEGYGLAFLGIDPFRSPERVSPAPRYVVMERYFDARGCGRAGRALMSASAGLQLNIEAGRPSEWADRLEWLYRLGPVLLAISASSPCLSGTSSGWVSMRQQAWLELEPQRSAPVPFGGDPGGAWADYALAAPVMLIRGDPDTLSEPKIPLDFADWIRAPHTVGRPPTIADLDYHLTTLFPPVRPRGYLELRFLDASPMSWWPGLAALAVTLIDDPVAADRLRDPVSTLDTDWRHAAEVGLHDPALRAVAVGCVAVALERCPTDLRADVERYAELVETGHTLGDRLRDAAAGDHRLLLREALDA
jgi:glutamate--cysteine ligase